MNTDRCPISELSGKAEFGGYVYVLKFTNGLVKPGRTRNPKARLSDHAKNAQLFGAELADWWVSPLHDGWKENEESLITFAGDLGGTALTTEYFSGVDFDDLLAKACALTFAPVDTDAALAARAARRRTPKWLSADLRRLHAQVRYDCLTKEEAASVVAELLVRDEPEFARVIVERWAAGQFTRLLKSHPPVDLPPFPQGSPA
jgi:hypothetical protein